MTGAADSITRQVRSLGQMGRQITYQSNQNLSLTARAGYGQNDDQDVAFSGAQFSGNTRHF